MNVGMGISSDKNGTNAESNKKVEFIFETRYVTDDPTLGLILVGSSECVGNWEIELSRLATENPDDVGAWITKIECIPNTSFDWKWALVKKSNGDVVRWEERSNRKFISGNTSLKIIAPWNGEMEILAISDLDSKKDKARFSPIHFFGGGKKSSEAGLNKEKVLCEDGKECNCQSVQPGTECANTRKSFSQKLKDLIQAEEETSETPEHFEINNSDKRNLLSRGSTRSKSMIVRTTSVIYDYCNIL